MRLFARSFRGLSAFQKTQRWDRSGYRFYIILFPFSRLTAHRMHVGVSQLRRGADVGHNRSKSSLNNDNQVAGIKSF